MALKALGIGYITGFIADACRDGDRQALRKAELAGKCAVFILLPLIASILETALILK
ncbi:MAG: SpoIIIAC/SpoIIIAD family protein [Oscillospiraceae bacterium]